MFPQRFNVFTLRFHLRILEISSCVLLYEKPGIDHENQQISVTKPLAETQWKRADTFKSTEALRKHETMPPFSSYTFPVVTVARKRNGILNHQVSAAFPNCGNTLFLPVLVQTLIQMLPAVASTSISVVS